MDILWRAFVIAAFALVVAILSMTMMEASHQTPPPRDEQATNESQQANQPVKNQTFLQRIFPDPISFFNFLLVIVTGGLLVIGLMQAKATKDAADAAKQSVELTKQSLRLSRRGFVTLKRYTVSKIGEDIGDPQTGFVIVWWWTTTGNAPALVRKNVIRTRTILADDKSPINWEKEVEAPVSSIPLGPDAEVQTEPLKVTLEAARRISSVKLGCLS